MATTAPTRPLRKKRARPEPAAAAANDRASLVAALGVAALVAWLAFDGGAYGVAPRTTLAIGVWWVALLGVAAGVLPLARAAIGVPALVTGGLLAAFVAWTGLSMAWAPNAERAFLELDRAALMLGVFLLALLLGTRANAGGWADGFGVGITIVGLFALASRLFPENFPAPATTVVNPEASRLEWPLDYANGLGILIALGIPFLLRAATAPRHFAYQAVAVAPIPALAAAIYLTSSRGATATALIAIVSYLLLTSDRAATVAVLLAAGPMAAAAISVVLERTTLANRPFEPEAVAEGRSAAPLIVGLCVGAALLFVGLRLLLRLVGERPRALIGAAAAVLAVLAVVVGVALADPVERFESFRQPPDAVGPLDEVDPNRQHLLSLNGTGRWQYWKASFEQWQEHPLVGQGAGSYESWWAQHGEVAMFVRDAHSLYAETLGELGLVGLLLVTAAFSAGLGTLLLRTSRSRGSDQALLAAFGAAFVAFAAAAGIDWMWEVTVVPVVGIACLGLLVGPATAREGGGIALGGRARVGARGAIALAAAFVLVLQAILLLSERTLRESRAAAAEGDNSRAAELALNARAIQPWSASAPFQLALAAETAGQLETALTWIEEAAERDPLNWRVWLVRTRLETKLGHIPEARQSLARVVELNPRSPLFAGRTAGGDAS